MAVSIDSRLWLAAHLLYPNSSQAFDVYQTLISQSDSSIKKNDIHFIYQKLHQIIEKIPAISSNKAFHVFDENTDQWRQIYKKSQKEQLVIFVGYFVFELSLKDIAGLLKLTIEKAHFLFHQTFKKSVFLNIRTEVTEKIGFKKFNEDKVSFLFTNENLIDYCLQTLSSEEMAKVRTGLDLYPELQAAQKQYDLIVSQMKSLMRTQGNRVTKNLIQTTETLSAPRESVPLNQLFIRNKKVVFSLAMSGVFLFMVVVRPQWVQRLSRTNPDHMVDLQEIKPQMPSITEKPMAQTSGGLVAQELGKPEPLAAQASATLDPKSNAKPIQKTAAVSAETTVAAQSAEDPAKPKFAEKPAEISHEVEAMNLSKKAGGLYRGVLTVTDLNEVTEKITQKLVDLGGKKAGEVELGWRKTEKLSYYHFTLPENNVDGLKEFLTKFGSLQIQFENHPRLMPAGVKRLIIEVKERE